MQVLRILHMTAPKFQYSLQELCIDQAQQREELQSKDSENRRLREELRKAGKVDEVREKVFWNGKLLMLLLADVPQSLATLEVDESGHLIFQCWEGGW